MRVLVCGGRDFEDRALLYAQLDARRDRMAALIAGCAPGADTLAWNWGWSRNFHCERYVANWKLHGRAAGPIRNQTMLDEGKPTVVLAFPRANGRFGTGTLDMIRRAAASGIEVVKFEGEA